MTASTGRAPTSERSRLRHATAERIRSKRSRSTSGIETRSASTPRRLSSSVRRRTCRSAPPSANGVWTARTRTRGASFKGGGSERHAPDERVVLRAEQQRVELAVVLRRLVEALRVRERRAILDARVREAGGLGQEAQRLGRHGANVRRVEVERAQ